MGRPQIILPNKGGASQIYHQIRAAASSADADQMQLGGARDYGSVLLSREMINSRA